MQYQIKKEHLIILLFLVGVIVLSSNIWGSSIYILDEAKNSVCAREMLDRGDLIVPTFNYELRTDKPPLHYFFMMISYSLFGVNEFSARFFSFIAGFWVLIITFFYTKKFAGFWTSFWATLALISSLHFVLEFHLAVPDPYLIFFISLSLFSFYDYYKNDKFLQLIIFYFSLALGVLTKGPVALGLPGLIIVSFLFFKRDFRWNTIWRFKPLIGLLLFFAITLPWYILVGIKTNGEWLNEFFFQHNLNRFSDAMEGHGGYFFIPFLYVAVGMLPFSVFFLRAFQKVWNHRKENEFGLLCLIVVMVFVIFFSFSSTKLPNYTMPSYPFLAVILGVYLSNVREKKLNIYFLISIFLGLLIVIGAFIALYIEKELNPLKFYTLLFLVIPVAAIIGFYFSRKKENIKALSSLSVGWILASLLFFYVIFPKIDSKNPVSEARKLIDRFDKVAYFGNYNPAFSFYVKKEIPQLRTPEDVINFFQKHQNAIVISTTKYENQLQILCTAKEIVRTKDLFETPTTLVYTNKKTND
ncbi:MAG: glycosyltransferase family 39 protein [Bacteroidales bacterium]